MLTNICVKLKPLLCSCMITYLRLLNKAFVLVFLIRIFFISSAKSSRRCCRWNGRSSSTSRNFEHRSTEIELFGGLESRLRLPAETSLRRVAIEIDPQPHLRIGRKQRSDFTILSERRRSLLPKKTRLGVSDSRKSRDFRSADRLRPDVDVVPERLFRRRRLSVRLQQVCKLLEGKTDHSELRSWNSVQREIGSMRFSSQSKLQSFNKQTFSCKN